MTFLEALKEASDVRMWMHIDGCGHTVKVAKAAILRNEDLVSSLSAYTLGDDEAAEDGESKIIWQYDGQTLSLN